MKTRFCLASFVSLACVAQALAAPAVHLWETNLVIPTYLAAPPSPVPRFYEGRTYQGAKATFYPYPVQDVLTDVKSNVTYKALFLENQYIQICVLPELGGRIFSAVDKSDGYNFFYRQHVIKPALIGMLGAWISGGVEWNVPHHHRATSFSPVDYTTLTNTDGSATIWIGEIELRHRMKWLVGMTLYPDRSYLELNCKVFNRTPFAWPMLFWINAAVHANANYQVIFPPSTEWAAQHAKPEFASWPIAHQVYGGADYRRGVDISWWKNHDTPKSFFAWNYQDDWFGGYDHGKEAGVVEWADHNVAPGKKFFEWGNGPQGEMWTKVLTDEDGPYLELMAGAWSDNQPDYSWIQPGETRAWKHWWYPIRKLGGIKAATRDAAVNLEATNGVAKIAVNVTKEIKRARVRLVMGSTGNLPVPSGDSPDESGSPRPRSQSSDESTLAAVPPGGSPSGTGKLPVPPKPLFDQTVDLSPATSFSATVTLQKDVPPENLRLSILDADGHELIAYQPAKPQGTPMPKPVQRPKPPKDYASTDELYFTGQRIEQLFSPSFEAAPYYEEILRRDPGDSRANTAMGISLCKQWRWTEAEKYLSNALARATANYIRPKDTEAFYYLGVALKAQGRFDSAYDAFSKAAWSGGWKGAANYELAKIKCRRGEFQDARELLSRCLEPGTANNRAALLNAAICRRLGDSRSAEVWSMCEAQTDPLANSSLRRPSYEERVPPPDEPGGEPLFRLMAVMNQDAEAYLEEAMDYVDAGLWTEASETLYRYLGLDLDPWLVNPMVWYLRGYVAGCAGDLKEEKVAYLLAATRALNFCSAHRWEEEQVLRRAMNVNTNDAFAPYFLGCLLYDNQPEHAIQAWDLARIRLQFIPDRDLANWPQPPGTFAGLVHRNLALAYAQHEKNIPKAIASLEKAVALDPHEPRFFYELDRLYEAGGAPVAQRLEMLTKHHAVVAQRDDALTREIVLLTVAGQADRALALLRNHHFRNWEGSSQIHDVYVEACLTRGQQEMAAKQYREALGDFEAALQYPENLEVGGAGRAGRTPEIQYLIGTACDALGNAAQAKAAFQKAAAGRGRGALESQYFHALALQKLGRTDEAKRLFNRLIEAGQEQLTRGESADYFAKFGEKQSERVRQANAHYLIGLGQLGLGRKTEAEREFQKTLELHPAHLGANNLMPADSAHQFK